MTSRRCCGMPHGYKTVHQTWRFVRAAPHSEEEVTDAAAKTAQDTTLSTRHRLQRLRIENRVSIPRLAEMIKCDANIISAYERGDETLGDDVVQKMERVLSR